MGEVTSAVIATSLVLIAVFVPVSFFPGTTGILYRQFSLTIAFSIAISAFNALTLSPALSAHVSARRRSAAAPARFPPHPATCRAPSRHSSTAPMPPSRWTGQKTYARVIHVALQTALGSCCWCLLPGLARRSGSTRRADRLHSPGGPGLSDRDRAGAPGSSLGIHGAPCRPGQCIIIRSRIPISSAHSRSWDSVSAAALRTRADVCRHQTCEGATGKGHSAAEIVARPESRSWACSCFCRMEAWSSGDSAAGGAGRRQSRWLSVRAAGHRRKHAHGP